MGKQIRITRTIGAASDKPTNIAILGKYSPLVECFNAIRNYNIENSTKARLVSAKTAEKIIGDVRLLNAVFHSGNFNLETPVCSFDVEPFFLDVVIAHEKRDEKFRKHIMSRHEGDPAVFIETGKYAGLKNTALLIFGLSTANLETNKGDIFISTKGANIIPIENYFESGFNQALQMPDKKIIIMDEAYIGNLAVKPILFSAPGKIGKIEMIYLEGAKVTGKLLTIAQLSQRDILKVPNGQTIEFRII